MEFSFAGRYWSAGFTNEYHRYSDLIHNSKIRNESVGASPDIGHHSFGTYRQPRTSFSCAQRLAVIVARLDEIAPCAPYFLYLWFLAEAMRRDFGQTLEIMTLSSAASLMLYSYVNERALTTGATKFWHQHSSPASLFL